MMTCACLFLTRRSAHRFAVLDHSRSHHAHLISPLWGAQEPSSLANASSGYPRHTQNSVHTTPTSVVGLWAASACSAVGHMDALAGASIWSDAIMSSFQEQHQQQHHLSGAPAPSTARSASCHRGQRRCDDDDDAASDAGRSEPTCDPLQEPSLRLPEALFSEGDGWLVHQRQTAAAAAPSSEALGCHSYSSQPSTTKQKDTSVSRLGAGSGSGSGSGSGACGPLSDLDHWFMQQHLLRFGPDNVPSRPGEDAPTLAPHPSHYPPGREQVGWGATCQQQQQAGTHHQMGAMMRQSPEVIYQLANAANLQAAQMASAQTDRSSSSPGDAQRDKLALLATLQKWQDAIASDLLHSGALPLGSPRPMIPQWHYPVPPPPPPPAAPGLMDSKAAFSPARGEQLKEADSSAILLRGTTGPVSPRACSAAGVSSSGGGALKSPKTVKVRGGRSRRSLPSPSSGSPVAAPPSGGAAAAASEASAGILTPVLSPKSHAASVSHCASQPLKAANAPPTLVVVPTPGGGQYLQYALHDAATGKLVLLPPVSLMKPQLLHQAVAEAQQHMFSPMLHPYRPLHHTHQQPSWAAVHPSPFETTSVVHISKHEGPTATAVAASKKQRSRIPSS